MLGKVQPNRETIFHQRRTRNGRRAVRRDSENTKRWWQHQLSTTDHVESNRRNAVVNDRVTPPSDCEVAVEARRRQHLLDRFKFGFGERHMVFKRKGGATCARSPLGNGKGHQRKAELERRHDGSCAGSAQGDHVRPCRSWEVQPQMQNSFNVQVVAKCSR